MGVYEELEKCVGFDWDSGKKGKNWEKHRVSDGGCEEILFNQPLVAGRDVEHTRYENRYYALGRTDGERLLFVAFTVRNARIRVISARDMTRREIRKYQR